MFYKTVLKDHIRIPPRDFGRDIEGALLKQVKEKFSGFTDQEIGIVIDVIKVNNYGEGIIIPGDGAAFYETEFEVIVLKVSLQESIIGKIRDITDFGAFMTLGPIEGMIHISQTMDDYVSFSAEKVLQGKEKGNTLKSNDICRAKVIALSFKDVSNPKIGLTMRQEFLGKLETIKEEKEEKNGKKESM
ncbi:MAG: DNA-directed RNA polymerase [Nanobdellota archaeon]